MNIRFARRGDCGAFAEIYAPYVAHTTVSFEYTPPSAQELAERFDRIAGQFPWLTAEEDGRVLGYAYAAPVFDRTAFRWGAELSVYLREGARGRGIGSALYRRLEELLERQGYCVLYALVTGENSASMRFHEAMGYTLSVCQRRIGFKQGRWLDLLWYEKRLRQTPPETPPLPVSHRDVGGSDKK